MIPKFKAELLEEVRRFLDSLNQKTRDKIIYNLRRSQIVDDNELFQKLNDNVREFRTLHNKTGTERNLAGYLPMRISLFSLIKFNRYILKSQLKAIIISIKNFRIFYNVCLSITLLLILTSAPFI